jgi:ABC-2 type transport system ATP-binding protein
VIDVRDVTRSFGRVQALNRVSFQIERGEIVALLGPNGAGKTTATRIIGAILAPSSGEVLVDGRSVRADPNAVRARCGLVGDQPGLYERMTLRAYLAFFAGIYDVPHAGSRTAELASFLGLADAIDRRLGTYSRGMKQKAAIARALLADPPVLLLDEPTSALDPEMTRTLRDLIVRLRAQHRAILLCTHDLDEAQRIADRVVILDRGRIVKIARTDELRVGARPAYVVSVAGDAHAAVAALKAIGVDAEATAADGVVRLRFTTDDPLHENPKVLRTLLDADIAVLTLSAETRTLEEAYFATMHEQQGGRR